MKFNYFRRAAMMLLVMMTVASAAAQTYNITQCTVTGLPTTICHDKTWRNEKILNNATVTDPNRSGYMLVKDTDYEICLELKDGTRVTGYDAIQYGYFSDNWDEQVTYKAGDVYNEKFIFVGKGDYEGKELEFPYRRFFLDWHRLDITNIYVESTYHISNAAQLELFAAAVNSGQSFSYDAGNFDANGGFIIAGDIEFDSNTINNFTPIGTAEHPFDGVLRGNGQTYHYRTAEEYAADPSGGLYRPDEFKWRTISGIRRTTADAPIGLFGCLGSGAVVSDVTLSDCRFTVSGTGVAGSIAGTVQSGATVERCLVKGGYIEGTTAGAIVGSNSGTLSRNYYTGSYVAIGGTAYPSNVGTAAGDVDGARRDVGLTVPGSLSLDDGTASGLVFDGSFYGGAGETLTFYEDTFDAYTTTGPVASFTHDAANYKYALAINNDAADAIAINHANHFGTDAGADGSEEHPYIITTTAGLDFLAELVNGDPLTGNTGTSIDSRYKFKDKFFKLGADIAYNPAALTFDLDNDGTEDCNYKPIAIGQFDINGELDNQGRRFIGTFDGNGHTISGIRINYPSGVGLGIFGLLGHYANDTKYWGAVKNLTVSNASINGRDNLGGIVGYSRGSTITNCHVANTVNIQGNGNNVYYCGSVGGIVGCISLGSVSHCTSAVTVAPNDVNFGYSYGGIVGTHSSQTTISYNLAINANVGGDEFGGCGAIAGQSDGTLDHNYYFNCTIGNDGAGKGYGKYSIADDRYYYADEPENDGAVPGFALFDDGDNRKAIALAATAGSSIDVKLVGRTLYKDGAWNTLCLPFAVSNITGTPLEGATVKTLLPSSSLAANGTLTLNFSEPLTAIEAGKPYIVKWDKALDYEGNESTYDISNPVFSAVTIAAATPESKAVSFTNNANNGGNCQFVGQYAPFTIGDTSTGTYDGDLNEILLLAADNKIGYSQNARTLRPQRCHFYVPTGTAGARAVNDFVLDFGHDESTRIISTTDYTDSTDSAGWFTLDGRKLTGEPAQKGIYIHNGHKVVIK